jgi:PASTA domain
MAETDAPPAAGGTVHVPGIGPMKKKTATIAGVAAGVLVVVYIEVRKRQAAAATPATGTAGTVTDAAGNVCSALDPSSNYCPGSAQDQAYYAQQSGVLGGGLGGPSGSGTGIVGYDQNGNPIYASSGSGVTAVSGPGSFTNNAQWASYCEQGMGSSGNDAIAAALGKYITGGPVTSDAQVTTIDEAIAIGGYPPTQGPGGKPPSINRTGNAPPPKPPPAAKVTVPRVVGDRVDNAKSSLEALGLKVSFGTRKPDKPYHVTAQTPKAGAKVNKGSTVHLTIAEGN